MAWNEPGSNGKDPWDSNGPPDLEEMMKKFRQRFGGNGGGGGVPGGGGSAPRGLITAAVVVGALLWLASGIYIVNPAERGVVLQFGQYLTTTGEGPHWHVPWPVQTVEKVNVDGIRNVTDKQMMLTKDENIVDVDLAVQYRVSSAEDYLFRVRDPDMTLRHALKSALREVVGKSSMDFILTAGREEVAERTKLLLQENLDMYQSGLVVTEVNIKDAQPPEPVQGAFADAIKAREDEQRLINEAEAYANEVVPRARGEAARMTAEALGYKTRVVEQASGEASRFLQLLAEYERAPRVTRDRLYLEAMNDVLATTSKVMVDTGEGGPLMYLPLDKMMSSGGSAALPIERDSSSGGRTSVPLRSPTSTSGTSGRSTVRERRTR